MIGKRIVVIVGLGLAAGCQSGSANAGVASSDQARHRDGGPPPSCSSPRVGAIFDDTESLRGFRAKTSFGPAEGFVDDVTADTITVQAEGESRVFRWQGPDLRARFLVNEEVTVSLQSEGTESDRSVRRHVLEGAEHRAVVLHAQRRAVPAESVSVRVQDGPMLSATNSILCIRTGQTRTRCGRQRSTTIWNVYLEASFMRESVELERGETARLGEWQVTSLGAASKRSPAVLALGCVVDAAGAATLRATALGPAS